MVNDRPCPKTGKLDPGPIMANNHGGLGRRPGRKIRTQSDRPLPSRIFPKPYPCQKNRIWARSDRSDAPRTLTKTQLKLTLRLALVQWSGGLDPKALGVWGEDFRRPGDHAYHEHPLLLLPSGPDKVRASKSRSSESCIQYHHLWEKTRFGRRGPKIPVGPIAVPPPLQPLEDRSAPEPP